MSDLTDQTILITGASQGLGAATARTLVAAGATVLLADINLPGVTALADELGPAAHPYQLDVTDTLQCEQLIAQLIDRHIHLDTLINNAGIDVTKPLTELTIEQIDRILAVNLRAPFVLSKLIFPHFIARQTGHIINITSTAARRAWPNASAYHASKTGLLGLSHALHAEGVPHGIQVTAVIAGGMATPFILDRFPEAAPTLQDPQNVADTIRYILTLPTATTIPELMVIPVRETSWP